MSGGSTGFSGNLTLLLNAASLDSHLPSTDGDDARPAVGVVRRRKLCICGCRREGNRRVNVTGLDIKATLKVLFATQKKRDEMVDKWKKAIAAGKKPDVRAASEHWGEPGAAAAAALQSPGAPTTAARPSRKRRRSTPPTLRDSDGVLTADIPPVTPSTPAGTPTPSLLAAVLRALPEDDLEAHRALAALTARATERARKVARLEADSLHLQRQVARLRAERNAAVAAPPRRAILSYEHCQKDRSGIFKRITGWEADVFAAFFDLVNAHGPGEKGMLDDLVMYSASLLRESVAAAAAGGEVPAVPVLPGAGAPSQVPVASQAAASQQQQGGAARPRVRVVPDVAPSIPLRRAAGPIGRTRLLTPINALMLAFVLLRTGLTFHFAGFLFGISGKTASSTFTSIITALERWLAVEMPSLSPAVAAALTPPAIARRFGSRIPTFVVDATEFRRDRAANLALHKIEFSTYKGAPTCKFQIGAHVGGGVVHVSNGYPGHATDNDLVERSRFLLCIPEGSRVLVDRGYTETQQQMNALRRGQKAVMPSFRVQGHAQVEATRVDDGANIANPRMVVERLIGRVKLAFAWFDSPHPGNVDVYCSAFRVAVMLTNYCPLLGEGISSESVSRVPLEPRAPPLPADSQRTSQE